MDQVCHFFSSVFGIRYNLSCVSLSHLLVFCERRTGFRDGRCAGVISMPSTMTSMLHPDQKYTIDFLAGWKSSDPKARPDAYWGRRLRFPGSHRVWNWDTQRLEDCTSTLCPKAEAHSTKQGVLVNYAPFFAEGGESYAIRGDTAPKQKELMQLLFGTVLVLSWKMCFSHFLLNRVAVFSTYDCRASHRPVSPLSAQRRVC